MTKKWRGGEDYLIKGRVNGAELKMSSEFDKGPTFTAALPLQA